MKRLIYTILGLALTESAMVRMHPTGTVQIFVGSHAHGQGHETTFAQIASDTLGVPYESIEIRHGDTAEGDRCAEELLDDRHVAFLPSR